MNQQFGPRLDEYTSAYSSQGAVEKLGKGRGRKGWEEGENKREKRHGFGGDGDSGRIPVTLEMPRDWVANQAAGQGTSMGLRSA